MSEKGVLHKLFTDIFSSAISLPSSARDPVAAAMIGAIGGGGGVQGGVGAGAGVQGVGSTQQFNKFPPMFPTPTYESQNYDIRKLKFGERAAARLAPATAPVQTGGKIIVKKGGSIKTLSEGEVLFKRIFLVAFLLFVSIYCASVTFQSKQVLNGVLKLKGESESADANLDGDDVNYIERWRRIAQILIVFSLFVFAYFLAIIVIMIFGIYLYYCVMAEKGQPKFEMTMDVMSDLFWTFDLDAQTFTMSFIYMFITIVILISMMVFLIYHLFVKSYLANLGYPESINPDKTDKPEFGNPTKFAYFYGIYLIVMILFFILLLSLYYVSTDNLLFVCILLILISMMFMMLIYKYTIERSTPTIIFVLWLVYFIWTIFTYFNFKMGLVV
jgi:hypothetical protein